MGGELDRGGVSLESLPVDVGAQAVGVAVVQSADAFGVEADLPNTRVAASTVFSIPVHPSLTDADVTRVVEAVNTVVAEAAA